MEKSKKTGESISVVIPVYNEDRNIEVCLRRLWAALKDYDHELLICYDFEEDTTIPAVEAMSDKPPTVRYVRNEFGRGPARAMRAGFKHARGDVVVTTMADLSDPPEVIPAMAEQIRRHGATVVSGSRYMKGGKQVGGPFLKKLLSRVASLSLFYLAGLPTKDATTNFRAYHRKFLSAVEMESEKSFSLGLELTVKAHLKGYRIKDVPSTWHDRSEGESNFQLFKWMPQYLRWYGMAIAGRMMRRTRP